VVTPVPAATPAPVVSATPRPNILGRFFNKPTPTPVPRVATQGAPTEEKTTPLADMTPKPGGGHGMVWVNTETKVFHREGSRYYGKTKQGKYMSEDEAVAAGYRPPARGQ
jgi:hypothetical protein